MDANILKYTPKELANIALLSSNKILYIEDLNSIYPYSCFLDKIFNGKIKIAIYPAKSKENVITVYRILANKKELKKTAFILDRDYDLILDRDVVKNERVLYLERYTLENYYVTKALWEKTLAVHLKENISTIRELYPFKKYEKRLEKEYLKLVPFFIMISKYNLTISYSRCSHLNDFFKDLRYCKNCDKDKETEENIRYCKNKNKQVKSSMKAAKLKCCKTKIKDLIKKIQNGKPELDIKKEYIFWRRKIRKESVLELVPGKELLKIFLENIRIETNIEVSKITREILSIENVDSSIDNVIKKLEKLYK